MDPTGSVSTLQIGNRGVHGGHRVSGQESQLSIITFNLFLLQHPKK